MKEVTYVFCECNRWVQKNLYKTHLKTKKHRRWEWEQNCHAADVTIPPYIEEITNNV
jgi:hypothetical protein